MNNNNQTWNFGHGFTANSNDDHPTNDNSSITAAKAQQVLSISDKKKPKHLFGMNHSNF